VSLLWNNRTYKYASLPRFDFRLTFAHWLKFSLLDELTYEIDVWLRKHSNQWYAGLDLKPRILGYMFGWVIVSRQLHFHIYYIFVKTYPKRLTPEGVAKVSDIPPRRPRITKMTLLLGILQTWQVVSLLSSVRRLSQMQVLLIFSRLIRHPWKKVSCGVRDKIKE
jgi:hypothetical protein